MRSVAVIGAGGFVGSRLIESCILNSFRDVYGIVRSYRNLARLCRFGSPVKIRIADGENEDALARAIKGCSTVVNLISGDPATIIGSTKAVYQACSRASVKRLIHLSSAVVYGEVESPAIDDDSLPMRNHWMPYARAKAEAELFLREVLSSSPTDIIVLRPGIVWGPRSRWSLSVVQDLLNDTAYLVGEGSGICNSIYIDNLVSCILTCCNYENNTSGFFNVSDDEVVTWRDFYASLAECTNYDMSRISKVPADRFRPSLNARLQDLMSLPIYLRLREYFSMETRARIKRFLKRQSDRRNYPPGNDRGSTRLQVTREMWHLQKTRHKLSNAKFSKQFNFRPPFSFRHGTEMTINWLRFLGV